MEENTDCSERRTKVSQGQSKASIFIVIKSKSRTITDILLPFETGTSH